MSRVHSKSSRVLVNEYAVSSDVTGYTCTHMRALSRATTLTDEGETYRPGLLSGAMALRALFDTAATGLYDITRGAVGTDDGYLVLVAPEGLTVGTPAFTTVSDLSGLAADAAVADLVTTTIDATPDNGVDWGPILHALTAETATGDGTSVDETAATANGGIAQLHVTAFSGLTNIVIKVEHSSDNSNWSDLATFATVTAATKERVTFTGTVNRYVRAQWTVTGTGSATFAVALGRR